MISARLARVLEQRNIHYGWVVAAITFLTMLATAAAMGSAGILIEPLQREFGWTNADISFAMALRLVLFGLMGPFAAAFMNQFGLRRVVTAALILIASGLLGSIFMTEEWQMVGLWGVVIGVGTGMTALVLGATVAARWFEKRRGLVVGMMTASIHADPRQCQPDHWLAHVADHRHRIPDRCVVAGSRLDARSPGRYRPEALWPHGSAAST
jgi:cyanate permease